jgi:hypothetical protein
MPCGYAVDGLGFYYIPHSAAPRTKDLSKTAIIKVIEGTLSVAQVTAEMERLVPGKGKWTVEEMAPNMYKTSFPS